jgi:hypothetical protein
MYAARIVTTSTIGATSTERHDVPAIVATRERRIQQLSRTDTSRQPDDQPDQRQKQPLPEHHAENRLPSSADRHPDSNFPRSTRGRIGDQAVQTDDR